MVRLHVLLLALALLDVATIIAHIQQHCCISVFANCFAMRSTATVVNATCSPTQASACQLQCKLCSIKFVAQKQVSIENDDAVFSEHHVY
jgi:hypothetical protein